ncbi:MAG: hypothetical protein MK179_20450, partial [Pirellulaceae bacterium]|nr:hypothetical protein [Pirellulaceae bacterium]
MTESSQWFVRKGQTFQGPFTSRQLKTLARESKVKPETIVRKGEEGDGVPAKKINGLFATEPARSTPIAQVDIGPPKFPWKTIVVAVVTTIIVTGFFATFFPWLALLSGMILLAGGIAFTAWPPMSERIAQLLRNQPRPSVQHRIYIAVPIVLCGAILLVLSQSQIRSNWRAVEVRAEVAQAIEDANTELEQGQVDKALSICSLLDTRVTADERIQLATIRARIKTIQTASRVKSANDQVRQLLYEGKDHAVNWQLDKAQSTLESALQTPLATEFQRAEELADDIVAKRTKSARRFIDAGDLAQAKEHAQKAVLVPSATDTVEARQIIIDISNREVAALVESARESLENMNRGEAAADLEIALAITNATEVDVAKKMFDEIQDALATEANVRVATLMADAQRAISAKDFDNALRTLHTAAAVAHSTKQSEVNAMIHGVQRAKAAVAETEEREKRIAKETQNREERIVRENSGMAWVMAQEFVKQKLRSPSTADFGSIFTQNFKDTVTHTGNNNFRVRGWVDAENAFGATIRNTFDCNLTYDGNDDWSCNSC